MTADPHPVLKLYAGQARPFDSADEGEASDNDPNAARAQEEAADRAWERFILALQQLATDFFLDDHYQRVTWFRQSLRDPRVQARLRHGDDDHFSLLLVPIQACRDAVYQGRARDLARLVLTDLVDAGVDVNVINDQGESALSVAVQRKSTAMLVQHLLGLGAKPDQGVSGGRHALHWSVNPTFSSTIDMGLVQALLDAGADPLKPAQDDRLDPTPWDAAQAWANVGMGKPRDAMAKVLVARDTQALQQVVHDGGMNDWPRAGSDSSDGAPTTVNATPNTFSRRRL